MLANQEIRELAFSLELILLAIKIDKSEKVLKSNKIKTISLDDISVEEVFKKRLALEELESSEFEEELFNTFREVFIKVEKQ